MSRSPSCRRRNVITSPATNPRRTSGYPIFVLSAATTKSHADMMPAPPATAAPCIAAIVTRRVWLIAIKVFATTSAVACAFVVSAASFKSRPVQNAAPAPRKINTRCCGCSEATLTAEHSSVINSSVSAFRRSGRLRVRTVISGDFCSIKTTGMGCGYKVRSLKC